MTVKAGADDTPSAERQDMRRFRQPPTSHHPPLNRAAMKRRRVRKIRMAEFARDSVSNVARGVRITVRWLDVEWRALNGFAIKIKRSGEAAVRYRQKR